MSGIATSIALGGTALTGAIVGAGALAAGATVYGASTAASATHDAATSAAQVQEKALAQQKELSQPYTDMGKAAIPTLENLLGIGNPGGPSVEQTLQQTPGYQFAKQQGLDATKSQAASMGMALSGNTLQGLDQFSTGLADQTYGAEVNRLMGVAGLGQAAASGQAANIGSNANNLSNIYTNQGNTLAGIRANEAAGVAGAIGSVSGSLLEQQTLDRLLPKTPAGP